MAKKCPVCSSERIFFFMGSETGQIFECKKCGYRGPLILESGEVDKKMQEDLKALKRELGE